MAGFGSGTHLHQNVIMLNAVMVAQLTWFDLLRGQGGVPWGQIMEN